ncbi:MAG: IS4 family transposase, partial [Ktedonobacteraceae bacterium]
LVGGPVVTLPLLQRFRAVYVEDGSTIALPAALAAIWRGCGGNREGKQAASYQGTPKVSEHPKTEAALKITVRWDLLRGELHGPHVQAGRTPDLSSVLREERMEKGSLWIADLGYFALVVLVQVAKEGVFFLTRYKEGVIVWRGNQRVDVVELLPQTEEEIVEVEVACGASKQVKARLLAQKVPAQVAEQRRAHLKERERKQQKPVSPRTWELCQWTILLTNVPATQLSVREAMALIRARWQIELLFKLWKSQGLLDEWSSQKPWQVLCEVYAKLLAMVVQHWLLIQGCWDDPHHSLVQAATVIREHSPLLREALGGQFSLRRVVQAIVRALQTGCSIPARPRRPSTSRLLEGEPFWGLT